MSFGKIAKSTVLLTVAVLQPLLVVTVIRFRPTAAAGDSGTANRSALACDADMRGFTFEASSSWQGFTLLAASQEFSSDCSVTIGLPASAFNVTQLAGWSSPSPALQPQRAAPALLLEIDSLQLGPSAAQCNNQGNTLAIFVLNDGAQTGYICNISTLYIWASRSINMYVYIQSNSNITAPFFTAAFLDVVSPINVCQQQLTNASSTDELVIDSEAYAFASESRYPLVPPNNVTCSPNANYRLTMAAGNVSSSVALELTVLAAPPNESCWSLLLDGQRRRTGDVVSTSPGGRASLTYTHDGAARVCSDIVSSGFTVRATVIAIPTLMTTATVGQVVSTVGSSTSGDRANSTSSASQTATTTASNLLGTSRASAASNVTVAGLSSTASVNPNASSGLPYSSGSSSDGGTPTVSLLVVAISCSVAGGVAIAAAACAIAALRAVCQNQRLRRNERKAQLYAKNEGNSSKGKPTALNADPVYDPVASRTYDTDF